MYRKEFGDWLRMDEYGILRVGKEYARGGKMFKKLDKAISYAKKLDAKR
jgi:hypothetical protein